MRWPLTLGSLFDGIGGFPLAPGPAVSPAPSLADTLGIPTPDYVEDE